MKKLQTLFFGLILLVTVVSSFSLIIFEFKKSIRDMDQKINQGAKLDRKLLEVTVINSRKVNE